MALRAKFLVNGELLTLVLVNDLTAQHKPATYRGKDESGRRTYTNLEGWTPHLISKMHKIYPVAWVIECGGDTFAVSLTL